ncbi:G patch domain and ankyrin repeat-containing protein 1 isoform X2 [Kryptolebias marmoratus]|uniref:Zinc finger protein 91-like n=1 Tax=Kryptolebias marmoratus TaxID=37003 RepID=A0A3Q3FAY5_KRYMA|nr:G patch domain and ankyrin repeat-containing protein 1 isoform X2 [Kryptolebias marmoratus]
MAALGFIPATKEDAFSIRPNHSRSKIRCKLSGEEARQFYEDLMKGNKTQDESRSLNKKVKGREESRRQRRRRAVGERQQAQTEPVVQRGAAGVSNDNQSREVTLSERSMELLGLRLLRCAHEGDIPGLKELLSKGVDINFQDTFLWTAVMCASWSGQRAAVRLLLAHGAAWVGLVDAQGRDAQDLALEAGHKDVLEELLNYGRSPPMEERSDSSPLQPQWCDVCGNEYRSGHSAHLSSTLHQFSLRRPPPTPYYCLPPSSNSYKMMIRCGWKPGEGLGPEGDGPKQPVATVLKRDQKGLGFGQTKRAKVTHFQAGDRGAVKLQRGERDGREQKGQRKEEARRQEQIDRSWERDFRASFYL